MRGLGCLSYEPTFASFPEASGDFVGSIFLRVGVIHELATDHGHGRSEGLFAVRVSYVPLDFPRLDKSAKI